MLPFNSHTGTSMKILQAEDKACLAFQSNLWIINGKGSPILPTVIEMMFCRALLGMDSEATNQLNGKKCHNQLARAWQHPRPCICQFHSGSILKSVSPDDVYVGLVCQLLDARPGSVLDLRNFRQFLLASLPPVGKHSVDSNPSQGCLKINGLI